MNTYILYDDEAHFQDIADVLTETAKQTDPQIPIKVDYYNPTETNWDTIFNLLVADKSNGNSIVGFITDQRLDGDNRISNGIRYRGTSLSQNIRTLSNEGKINEFPVILYYAPVLEQTNQSVFKDSSGTDLFDWKLNKDDVMSEHYPEIVHLLFELSEGYKRINQENGLNSLLAIEDNFLDGRIESELKKRFKSTHEFAMFLKEKVILVSGLLINENILAARLGVYKKCTDWQKIKEILNEEQIKYKGVFANIQEVWWSDKLLSWWKENLNTNKSISNLSAQERVNKLNEKFHLNLQPITLEEKSRNRSSCFWTVCAKTQQPIDPNEGVLTNRNKEYFWQDPEYVSKDFVVNNLDWEDYNYIEEDSVTNLRKK